MSIEIRIPDIGDFDAVDVVDVLIKVGDTIETDQSILVLESDKASMEVPADHGGVVENIKVQVGDKVKKGDIIAILSGDSTEQKSTSAEQQNSDSVSLSTESEKSETVDAVIPDIGDFDQVSVVEVNISSGQVVAVNDTLVTLESDKASMEVPAEVAGTIVDIKVKVGDKVSTGDIIATLQTVKKDISPVVPIGESSVKLASHQDIELPKSKPTEPTTSIQPINEVAFANAYASPSVRKLARELGVDLGQVTGTGRKNRITTDDVKIFVKQVLQSPSARSGSGIPAIPVVDFSKFGETETQQLSRINVLTGEAMTRCWLNIPHVTQHDKCDITELEAFRQSLKAEAEKRGIRVTMVSFLIKALAEALKVFPRFNSSLSADGDHLILKKYCHIGVAVDTPNGLVVPVIHDADQKGIYELSEDLMVISKKARDGKLTPKDMSGASITISSLGGIGGEYFTPIVNAPEVAILGVSRATMQPVWNGKEFVPRLMLPLSLSYDHRVIDGALGARMIVYLDHLLTDIRRALL